MLSNEIAIINGMVRTKDSKWVDPNLMDKTKPDKLYTYQMDIDQEEYKGYSIKKNNDNKYDLFLKREEKGYNFDSPEKAKRRIDQYLTKYGKDSRPETISYVKRQGFNIVPCKKFKGSKIGFVRDGIEFIRKFEMIHIHERCKQVRAEFEHYSYKVSKEIDPNTKKPKILPILVDAYNHCIDSLRYSMEDLIQGTTNWLAVIGEE